MEVWQTILMYGCGIGAAFLLAVLGLMFFARQATPVVTWMRRHRLETLWLAPFVIAMVYTGATKETRGRVEYPYTDIDTRYLIDAGSFVTNGYAHISFTLSPIVPTSAPLMIAVRPVGSTNDLDWAVIVNTTFASFNQPQDIVYSGAETKVFQVFTTWTPGPAVHTNGVAVVEWQRPMRPSIHEVVPRRTGIYENGIRVAPNPGLTNGPPISMSVMLTPNNTEGENE